MNDREKLHWIDACPQQALAAGDAAGDAASLPPAVVSDPQARELAARVRDCDEAVRQSMEDVAVPSGLSSRLLARLEQARVEAAATAATSAAATAGESTTPDVLPLDRRLSRRRWIRGSAAAALLATVGLGVQAYLNRPAAELTNEELWAEFLARFEAQSAQVSASQAMASAPRKTFPVCELNAGVAVRGWQSIAIEAFSRDGVCYHLKSAGGRTALLWVLPLEGNPPVAPHLATSPLQSSRNTAGLAVTAWRSRDVVYVLVAQGDALTPFVGRPGLT